MGDQVSPDLITVNSKKFPDGGEYKSLGFKNADGKEARHGVLIPGSSKKFDFGPAERREEILVVSGMIGYKGQWFGVFNEEGTLLFKNVIVIKPGENILLDCRRPATYHVIYD